MTTHVNDLLVEIGAEELPPKALRKLSEALAAELAAELEAAGFAHGVPAPFATPRRLAALVPDVPATQPDREIERRGPPLARAFDEHDKPTKAALGFARSVGIEVDRLVRIETGAGAWLGHRSVKAGASLSSLLPGMVVRALARLPAPAADAVGGPRHRVRPARALGGADARAGGRRGRDPRHPLRTRHPRAPIPPPRRHRAGGRGPLRGGAPPRRPCRGRVRRTHGDDPRAGRAGGGPARRTRAHRPGAARGERRARRMAGRDHRPLRHRVPRPSRRGARRHHAGTPALLPRHRPRRRADAALRRGEQHREP